MTTIIIVCITNAIVLLFMFFSLRRYVINKCYKIGGYKINHHEINEHKYRRPLMSGGRDTTSVSKDELLDLILDHLDLTVVEMTQVNAKLVPTEDTETQGDFGPVAKATADH